MEKLDFTKEKVAFDNGHCKWYVSKHFQKYLEMEQADNLPKLKGYGCFIVRGEDVEDYVLINSKQTVLASYKYNNEGFGQMEARINIMKISKHYDDYEKITFNEFCHKSCDGLYDPKFGYEEQCNGYKQLREMVIEKIQPASLEETERWEKNPTLDELLSKPNIKYLRFLHVLLRPHVIKNWEIIKTLKIDLVDN